MNNHDVTVYAQSVGAKVMGTSAKSGSGVHDLFLELTKTLLSQQRKQGTNQRGSRGPKSRIAIVDDDESGKKESGGCCLLL